MHKTNIGFTIRINKKRLYPANRLHKFIELEQKMLSQIELLRQSNKTAYIF